MAADFKFTCIIFLYVDPDTMEEEDYFLATKISAENYNKISTLVPVPKHWIGFSYIHSEYYMLDLNVD